MAMLILEIFILALTCGGALYGIWSKADLNKVVAIISTAFTVCGVMAGVGLSVWKAAEAEKRAEWEAAEAAKRAVVAEQKRTNDLRTVLASTDLADLKVVWSFAKVPKKVGDVLTLGELIVDSHLLRDDELSRAPREVSSVVAAAWHLSNTITPLIFTIERGDADLKSMYEGEEPASAIKRWLNKDDEDSDWVDDVGSRISYIGPSYAIMFPLNPQANAVLSLGNSSDDVALSSPRLPWQEDMPDYFRISNYGFQAEAERASEGLTITWAYDAASLRRAVVRGDTTKLTAGLPDRFSFIIVHGELKRADYLRKVLKQLQNATALPTSAKPSAWNETSKLEVFVNGLKDPHYTFDVVRAGTFSYAPDRGAYDAPEVEYKYTRFDCVLSALN